MQALREGQGFGHHWAAFRLLPLPSARLPMVGSVLGHWLLTAQAGHKSGTATRCKSRTSVTEAPAPNPEASLAGRGLRAGEHPAEGRLPPSRAMRNVRAKAGGPCTRPPISPRKWGLHHHARARPPMGSLHHAATERPVASEEVALDALRRGCHHQEGARPTETGSPAAGAGRQDLGWTCSPSPLSLCP